MMPRIEAKERLSAITTAALCNNVAFKDEAARDEMVEALERKVAGLPEAQPVPPSPADLAGMGIGLSVDTEAADLPSLEEWLGHSPSSKDAAREQDHG